MKLTITGSSTIRKKAVKGAMLSALAAGVLSSAALAKHYYTNRLDAASHRKQAAVEAAAHRKQAAEMAGVVDKLVTRDEYDGAWNYLNDMRKKQALPEREMKAFISESDSKIHSRKISRVDELIHNLNYNDAKKLLDEFKPSLPVGMLRALEKKLAGIEPSKMPEVVDSVISQADKYFYARHSEKNYSVALNALDRIKNNPKISQRAAYYRITMIEDCLGRYSCGDEFLIGEIQKTAQFHPGIEDDFLKRDFLRSALTYIGSTHAVDSKNKIAEALLEKTPVIFKMSDSEKAKFYRDALESYVKFFRYLSGGLGAYSAQHKYEILTSIAASSRKYGVDVSDDILAAVEKSRK